MGEGQEDLPLAAKVGKKKTSSNKLISGLHCDIINVFAGDRPMLISQEDGHHHEDENEEGMAGRQAVIHEANKATAACLPTKERNDRRWVEVINSAKTQFN